MIKEHTFDRIDLIRKFLTELMEIPEEGNENPNADTGADLQRDVSGGRRNGWEKDL